MDIQNPLGNKTHWTHLRPHSNCSLIAEELEEESLEVLPPDLSRFESHLRQPVRMHNIREKMQKSGKFQPIITENNSEVDRAGLGKESQCQCLFQVIIENGISVDPIDVYAKTQHVFAEVDIACWLCTV